MEPLLENLLEDCYYTNRKHSGNPLQRLVVNNSVYFNASFAREVYKNSKLARSGRYTTEMWIRGSLNVFSLIEKCGGNFSIKGLSNIDKIQDPVIFISNHMSMMEPIIFPGIIALRRDINFVAKTSVVTNSFFGPIMRSRNPITVDRKKAAVDFIKMIREGQKKLEGGESLIIFPEGTRRVNFDPKKFNKIGIKLAKKTNSYIVPIALKTDFWKNGRMIKDVGGIDKTKKIHIKFGEPLKIVGQGKKEHQMITTFIKESLNEWS